MEEKEASPHWSLSVCSSECCEIGSGKCVAMEKNDFNFMLHKKVYWSCIYSFVFLTWKCSYSLCCQCKIQNMKCYCIVAGENSLLYTLYCTEGNIKRLKTYSSIRIGQKVVIMTLNVVHMVAGVRWRVDLSIAQTTSDQLRFSPHHNHL